MRSLMLENDELDVGDCRQNRRHVLGLHGGAREADAKATVVVRQLKHRHGSGNRCTGAQKGTKMNGRNLTFTFQQPLMAPVWR